MAPTAQAEPVRPRVAFRRLGPPPELHRDGPRPPEPRDDPAPRAAPRHPASRPQSAAACGRLRPELRGAAAGRRRARVGARRDRALSDRPRAVPRGRPRPALEHRGGEHRPRRVHADRRPGAAGAAGQRTAGNARPRRDGPTDRQPSRNGAATCSTAYATRRSSPPTRSSTRSTTSSPATQGSRRSRRARTSRPRSCCRCRFASTASSTRSSAR